MKYIIGLQNLEIGLGAGSAICEHRSALLSSLKWDDWSHDLRYNKKRHLLQLKVKACEKQLSFYCLTTCSYLLQSDSFPSHASGEGNEL